MIDSYNIQEHKHRFASWAACRAASTSSLCRFRVRDGVSWLELSGLDAEFQINDLPEPEVFNDWHKEHRDYIVDVAKKTYPQFTHGIAAKLINIYMKSRFLCEGYVDDPRIKAFHPPIDSVLLMSLSDENVGGYRRQWKDFNNLRWSKFDSDTYEAVIKHITKTLKGKPLWMIESYWQGYQS